MKAAAAPAAPATPRTTSANRRKAPVAPALAAMPSLVDDALATVLQAQFSPEAGVAPEGSNNSTEAAGASLEEQLSSIPPTWHEKEHEALRGLHRHIQAAQRRGLQVLERPVRPRVNVRKCSLQYL